MHSGYATQLSLMQSYVGSFIFFEICKHSYRTHIYLYQILALIVHYIIYTVITYYIENMMSYVPLNREQIEINNKASF